MAEIKEQCGVFGIVGHPEAANLTYLGLYALQHRGQESAGIAAADGEVLRASRSMGHVAEAFDEQTLRQLPGHLAIGHTRYSTAGESRIENAQPFLGESAHGPLAIGHNGTILNARELRDELIARDAIFRTSSDTEVVLHLCARSAAGSIEEALVDALVRVRGAYSLVVLTKDRLIAARDPHGFRPFALGRLGDAWIACSETCALDLIGATYEREIEPGEIVSIGDGGLRSITPLPRQLVSHCVFEHVYFARPDSYVFGRSVHDVRTELGKILAREAPAAADIVVPIPDSGVCAAVGFSEEAGLPMRMGLIRNHYVGRTFIQPRQSIRHFSLKVKLNPVRSLLDGKRVVLVDDSIVRATTSRRIVEMVRAAGAREVHVRISCPPTVSPCFYGVDTPSRSELIAASHSIEEIRRHIDADSLAFLSLEGLRLAIGDRQQSYCTSCYTGIYPIGTPQDEDAYVQLALKGDD